MLHRLKRLPTERRGRASTALWGIAIGCLATGLVFWALAGLDAFDTGSWGGIVALWLFVAAAAAVALVLPLEYAVVSPLFMGVVGWLVDMVPLVILAGWTACVLRWGWSLVRDRRLPRGGRFVWLPIALIAWTALGVAVVSSLDFKHFLLLLGIQVVASGVILILVDTLGGFTARVTVASGLVAFVVLLSAGVLLQWVGLPIQPLQDEEVSERVEAAYGVDAFPNNIGMIKYARARNGGALEFRRELDRWSRAIPEVPPYTVFVPQFHAFENYLVVRFDGSARHLEDELDEVSIDLLYDNVGLAPGNSVPRLRSFPRNALTYAGVCAAVFPFALFLSWSGEGRRRLLGRVGTAACLFGAGLSLARGAWVAIGIGVLYLVIDGVIAQRQKVRAMIAVAVAAILLTGLFVFKYGENPVTARAGSEGSINTRANVYEETVESVDGLHLLLGFGTEKPRTESGESHEGSRYIPRAGTHSTYLNYLFRTGIPGALLVLALYVVAFLQSRGAARARPGSEAAWHSVAAAAVLVAAAHAGILSLYVEPIYTLTISIVLGLATAGTASLPVSILPWRRSQRTAEGA